MKPKQRSVPIYIYIYIDTHVCIFQRNEMVGKNHQEAKK